MRFSNEEKTKWLESWRKSGKRAFTFAKENGLCPQTFSRWTKIKQESRSDFIEIPLELIPPMKDNHEILIEKGIMKIHIPLSLGCSELRAIFGALGEAV